MNFLGVRKSRHWDGYARLSAVVEELVPDLLTIGEIQKVLQNLLREGVPIRNFITILETLADTAAITRDTDYLTEYAGKPWADK